jgi:acetylornithine deacetylase
MFDNLSMLRELVAIDSTNPDLGPGAGEGALAEVVAGWLDDAGLEVTEQEVESGRPNVVGVAPGSGGGKSLMINAHFDTVGVEGYSDPFTATVSGGRCYGRGSLDTKAGVVAAVRTIVAAAEMELAGDVIFTGVIDEEARSKGTEALVHDWSADGAVVLEPTNLEIVVAHRGFAWGEITVHGVAAHGSNADSGVDAITHASPVLAGIAELHDELQGRRSDPLVGPGAVHASLIRGGQEISSYPAKCIVHLERRMAPGESPQDWEGDLARLAALVEAPATADHAATFHRAPLRLSEDEPIVMALAAAVEAADRDPVIGGAPFWTDAALLTEAGIPAVVFGPGGEGLHSHEEWVEVSTIDACREVLVGVVAEFCD